MRVSVTLLTENGQPRNQFTDRLFQDAGNFSIQRPSIDFSFFSDIVSKDKYPEYNGYCYRLSNDQGLSVRLKTKIIHMPFPDTVPENPAILQTFMTQVKKLSF